MRANLNSAGRILMRAALAAGLWGAAALWAQAPATPAPAKGDAAQPAADQTTPDQTKPAPFYVHAFHAKQLGFDCNVCHQPVSDNSVELKRPGHEVCMACHADAFDKDLDQKICSVCHNEFPPTSADSLYPFPRYEKQRAILFTFAHAKHVDPKGRINPKTGFRADCTFCHHFESNGDFATFPGHVQCAACHSKPGMKPHLAADSTTDDCRTCHSPEETENPGFTEQRRMIGEHVVSGKIVNLRFTHVAHFREKDQYNINCTTCHYAVPQSTSLSDLTLPKMLDCVECHDTSKTMPAQFRMTNCSVCHIDKEQPGAIPASHTIDVKPAFHTESFRTDHAEMSQQPGAKCFVCHQNVNPSAEGTAQCLSCHQTMRPASHTARWKDTLHGQFAAIDRESCTMCHSTDQCTRCHSELPRNHQPLALFKGGAHARAAMLDERSCFTCHTFENTCAECHTQGTTPR